RLRGRAAPPAEGQGARVEADRLAVDVDGGGGGLRAGEATEVEVAGVDVLGVGEELAVGADEEVEGAAAVALALELAGAAEEGARVGERVVGAAGQRAIDLVEQVARE